MVEAQIYGGYGDWVLGSRYWVRNMSYDTGYWMLVSGSDAIVGIVETAFVKHGHISNNNQHSQTPIIIDRDQN
jgi:hypothetical protein